MEDKLRPRTNSEYLRRQNRPQIGGKELGGILSNLRPEEQAKLQEVLRKNAKLSQKETERKNFALLNAEKNDDVDKTSWFYKIREQCC